MSRPSVATVCCQDSGLQSPGRAGHRRLLWSDAISLVTPPPPPADRSQTLPPPPSPHQHTTSMHFYIKGRLEKFTLYIKIEKFEIRTRNGGWQNVFTFIIHHSRNDLSRIYLCAPPIAMHMWCNVSLDAELLQVDYLFNSFSHKFCFAPIKINWLHTWYLCEGEILKSIIIFLLNWRILSTL